jgi:hypothetical protein
MPMASKTDFTPDEWRLLLESPMMTSMAVTAADPSGLWGMLKESFASGTSLSKAISDPAANPLIKAVATEFTTSEGRSMARDDLKSKLAGSKPGDIKLKSVETLKQVSALIDAKAPADSAAFKSWLRQISENVAEAAEEGGGFMGFGGVKVSEAEKATLADISRALGS